MNTTNQPVYFVQAVPNVLPGYQVPQHPMPQQPVYIMQQGPPSGSTMFPVQSPMFSAPSTLQSGQWMMQPPQVPFPSMPVQQNVFINSDQVYGDISAGSQGFQRVPIMMSPPPPPLMMPSAHSAQAISNTSPWQTVPNGTIERLVQPMPKECTGPQAIIYPDLHGKCRFVPVDTNFTCRTPPCSKLEMKRLFVGQVPYNVPPEWVAWALHYLSNGRHVYYLEQIVRWRQGMQPTGCYHCYCLEDDMDALLQAELSTLWDTGGLWHPSAPAEHTVVAELCDELRTNTVKRPKSWPYQLMTVQVATSKHPWTHE